MPGGVADSDQARDLMARARELREGAGISLAKMAAEVGCSKPALSIWERRPPADLGRLPRVRPVARRWLAILAVLDATSGEGAQTGSAPPLDAR
jgi:transcriptional regulator with XRE-family HTH domain